MDPQRVEEIYDELGTLVVELDADPSARGPAYLQDLIAKTRGYLNRTSLLLHETMRDRHALERSLDAQEAAYAVSSDELLAEDARVTKLPSVDDRKAMINLLLREDRSKITDLKRQVKEITFVEKAVRHRHKELDNTISVIRMQKSIIDSEIRTGAAYGDETDTSRGTVPYGVGVGDDIGADELARLFDTSLAEETQQQPVTVEAASVAAPEPVSEPPVEPPAQDVVVQVSEEPKGEETIMTNFLDGNEYDELLRSI